MPPDQYWHCSICIFVAFMAFMCSTLFILSMTFERFYSIIRPHKAVSINTFRKAKISIVCIVIFSIISAVPHLFISSNYGRVCISNVKGFNTTYGQMYYWFTVVVQFVIPFVSLLTMTSVIIHTLRRRSMFLVSESDTSGQGHSQGQSQGQNYNRDQSSKMRSAERQIYVMLLLVTFGFLVLVTPVFSMAFYVMSVEGNTPFYYAGYHLFYHVGEKSYYTCSGINFFLYVISGHKFRSDLIGLFRCRNCRPKSDLLQTLSDVSSKSTSIHVIS